MISKQMTGNGVKTRHLKLPVKRRIRMGVRPKALLTDLNPGFPMSDLCHTLHPFAQASLVFLFNFLNRKLNIEYFRRNWCVFSNKRFHTLL